MEEKTGTTKAQAWAGYLLSFYKDVQDLTFVSANYIDQIVTVSHKHKDHYDGDSEQLTDEEKTTLRALMMGMRQAIFMVNIKFVALTAQMKDFKKEEKAVKDLYEKLIEKEVYDRKDVEMYTQKMNEVLLSGVGENVLSQIAQFLDRVSLMEAEQN